MTIKKKISTLLGTVFLLLFATGVVRATGETPEQVKPAHLDNPPADLKDESADPETEFQLKEDKEDRAIHPVLYGLEVAGGISAGFFYASNPGEDESDNEFLLSNFLVEVSSKDNNSLVSFVGAFGETSTPSLLDPPVNNKDFDIEYASFTLTPQAAMTLEAGLLQPSAGFENTYTFNNQNIVLGVTASQQPYNAYGARLTYSMSGLDLYGGYYKTRLDREEYCVDGSCPSDSWEIGIGGALSHLEFNIYNYHLGGLKNLTGAVIESAIRDVYVALNIDFWKWDSNMRSYYGRSSSTACALYVSPDFGRLSIPVRLEYIDQGESKMYSESTSARHIYTVTVSPTYTFCERAYVRVESSYVAADHAFAEKEGDTKSNRVYLAAEIGILF